MATGVGEFDRVLGGGLVPGAVVLLAGEPGVGKSTLLLDVAARWGRSTGAARSVSGEESVGQIRLRADRIGAGGSPLLVAAESDVAAVLGHLERVQPSLLVVDSVQTLTAAGVDGAAGGVAQVRAVAAVVTQAAKASGLPVVLVGHVTKDGAVAGPRTLEHLVDVVVSFEGDRRSGFRMVRAVKNRFGPADEVGCFELADGGIREVPDPSGVFTSQRGQAGPGTALAAVVEGRRPLLAEVQALVGVTGAASPRRVSHGLEAGRLAMILAVLQRRAGVRLHVLDVYAASVGGARVTDPAADLAVAVAVASAVCDQPVPPHLVAIGEIGLTGDLRPAPDLGRRLAEAARLGCQAALVPAGGAAVLAESGGAWRRSADGAVRAPASASGPGLAVIESPTLADALASLGLTAGSRRAAGGLRVCDGGGRPAEAEDTPFGPVAAFGNITPLRPRRRPGPVSNVHNPRR
jgi:DNA repair protein RadA/Sms